MKRIFAMATLGAALVVSAATVWAGASVTSLVTVNNVTRVAEGGIQAARSSADAVQYILCAATASMVSCEAQTSGGVVGICSVSTGAGNYVAMREAVLNINAAS